MDQHQWWLNRVLCKAFFVGHVYKENLDIVPFIDELVAEGLLEEMDGINYRLTENGLEHVLADLWNQLEAEQ